MARPRTVSDEDMLSAARAVFLEQGAGASTAAIAERLGVSQAALFKRFGTKQELMVSALAPPAIPPFVPLVAAGPDVTQPAVPQLRAVALAVMRFLREMVPAMMVLTTCGIDPKDLVAAHPMPPPLLAQRAVAAWFARAAEAGLVRASDPDALAYALMGSLHMRVFLASLMRTPLTDDALTEHVRSTVDTLWSGLAPSPTEATP
jgi:AcrR family transcriptional regulator